MLTINSAASQSAGMSAFEYWPSARTPRSASTCKVGFTISPSAAIPALEGAITSEAACRAMASAIWLRQEFPTHTNKTFTRLRLARAILWPAARQLQEVFVHGGVRGQLGMKRGRQHASLPHQHRPALGLRKHFDPAAHLLNDRGADENHLERRVFQLRGSRTHLAGYLPAVGVARDHQVGQRQGRLRGVAHLARQQDGARTSAEEDAAAGGQRADGFLQAFFGEEFELRGALAARQDQGVHVVEVRGGPDKNMRNSQPFEHRGVGFKVSLNGQDANLHFPALPVAAARPTSRHWESREMKVGI